MSFSVFAEPTSTKAVTFLSGNAQPLTIKKVGELALRFDIAKGMHVQANPSDPPLIPTNVSVSANKDLEVFTPKYPAGKKAMIKGLGREISTYEGTFVVKVPARALKATKPGTYKIDGEIRYQACDDKLCYPPDKVSFSQSVSVKK